MKQDTTLKFPLRKFLHHHKSHNTGNISRQLQQEKASTADGHGIVSLVLVRHQNFRFGHCTARSEHDTYCRPCSNHHFNKSKFCLGQTRFSGRDVDHTYMSYICTVNPQTTCSTMRTKLFSHQLCENFFLWVTFVQLFIHTH